MTYTPTTLVGVQLANALTPWLNDQLSWYLDAIGAEFQQTASLVQDTGTDNTVGFNSAINGYGVIPYVPGYGQIFNPNTCPSAQLGYLGQFVGVSIPQGQDAATALSLVKAESGLARGTPTAILAAANRNLTGGSQAQLIERVRPDGKADAYWFQLIVQTANCPNPAALTAAVNAVIPGGVLWVLVETNGFTWSQATGTWSADTMTWAQTSYQQP